MIDYVLAKVWLSATPEESTEPRYKSYVFELPDIQGGEDIIHHLESLGYSRSVGQGVRPIDYSELRDWMHLTGVKLNSWESETLFNLSNAHASMSMRAFKKDCPAPYQIESTSDMRQRINDKIFG